MSFVTGDEVRLKSGGPPMTVEFVAGTKVNCAWFDGRETKRDTFEAAMLKPYSRPAVVAARSLNRHY